VTRGSWLDSRCTMPRLDLPGALEALAQLTPDTRPRQAISHYELSFAALTEIFLAPLSYNAIRCTLSAVRVVTCTSCFAEALREGEQAGRLALSKSKLALSAAEGSKRPGRNTTLSLRGTK